MTPAQEREPIALDVNGLRRESRADPETPLLHVLRNDFGLVAARFGCGTEQCGACVVLLDGRPAYACTVALAAARGKRVTTLEGLADADTAHPLQRALLAEQAGQCGYCLSGITLRAAALLAATPDPSEDEVRTALDGHLCRCGAHNRIVRAVLRAAREMQRAVR